MSAGFLFWAAPHLRLGMRRLSSMAGGGARSNGPRRRFDQTKMKSLWASSTFVWTRKSATPSPFVSPAKKNVPPEE